MCIFEWAHRVGVRILELAQSGCAYLRELSLELGSHGQAASGLDDGCMSTKF